MEKYYSFAGVDLVISIPDGKMYTHEGALAPFRVDSVTDPHVFRFEMVHAMTPPQSRCIARPPGLRIYREDDRDVRYIGAESDSWQTTNARVEHRGKTHEVQLLASKFPDTVPVKIVLDCLAGERLVLPAGGFVFHSSFVDCDGKAILFTAPCGTGKSTQAELWHSLRGTEIINGDRSVIRCTKNGVYACGIPFAGSSQYCKNHTLPIRTIVYLEQAPKTTIRGLKGYEAFSKIWEGASVNTWNKSDVQMASAAVQTAAEQIPVFCLSCTPDESAVIALENALRKREQL